MPRPPTRPEISPEAVLVRPTSDESRIIAELDREFSRRGGMLVLLACLVLAAILLTAAGVVAFSGNTG